jgi:hypothetical protein
LSVDTRMQRSWMRRSSSRFRARAAEAKPTRMQLLRENPKCMVCGRRRDLSVHEIASGANRQKALDKRFALLVVCWECNSGCLKDRRSWPEARQLALLKVKSPEDYDLRAYNDLVNPRAPNRITEEEVENFTKTIP